MFRRLYNRAWSRGTNRIGLVVAIADSSLRMPPFQTPKPAPGVPNPVSRVSHLFQRQLQISNDVVPVFEANGDPDSFWVHSKCPFLGVGQGGVRH